MIDIISAVQRADIPIWLDGGWGIDALIGTQSRDHDDLDCVIALAEAPSVLAVLTSLGFAMTRGELPTRFVVQDLQGRVIDFHTVTFDHGGQGIQQLQDGTLWTYPARGFLGTGCVAGFSVPCLSADVQVLAHLGYEPDTQDVHDMNLLAGHFGIELPAAFHGAC